MGGQGETIQATMPDESWVDVPIHGFHNCGSSALFDMQSVNLDAGSYLIQTSAKALEKVDKEKKEKYI